MQFLQNIQHLKLLSMAQCTADLTSYAQKIILYSGRGPSYKGNYEMCVDDPALNYALVQFGIGGMDLGTAMGACYPRSCSDMEVSMGIDSILGMMNSSYSVYSVDSHISDYHVGLDWLSYITIIILATIVFLTIWASSRKFFAKETKKHMILDAFDLNNNISYFKIRQGQDLNIMDGIRAIAMMWVVIGHAYSFSLSAGSVNLATITNVANRPFFLLIEAGLLAVDIFFMLGGFFLAFAFLREKASGIAAFGLGILQRALRIWPAYIIAMLFYYSLFMPTGSGMFWKKAQNDVAMCHSMWREILFVANFIDRGQETCLGWGWYLQVDFQLFVYCLILLFLYQNSKLATVIVSFASMIGSTIFNIVFTYNHEIHLFTDLSAFANFEDFMLDLYMKPYGRCTPYLMGLLLGIQFMEYRNMKKEHAEQKTLLGKISKTCKDRRVRIVVEWLGIGLMSFVAFIPRGLQTGDQWPQIYHSLYWGLSKPVFLLGMGMTILPTILGHRHSFFNLILTPKLFHLIARISFCTYLVHLMVLYYFILSRNYNIYYNIIDNFITYLGLLIVSLIYGFISTVLVELPFAKIQKEVLSMLKAKQKAKQTIQNNKEISDSLLTTEISESGNLRALDTSE